MSTWGGDYEALCSLALKEKTVIVVLFYADWCVFCHRLSRRLQGIASEFPRYVFVKVNIDENRRLAANYNITGVPHVKLLRMEGGSLRELMSIEGSKAEKIRAACSEYSQLCA
jgi:thioredoxin-like negative regulator of GroEL